VETGASAQETRKEVIVKQVRRDKTFVYFYAIAVNGESRGLRFSRGTVATIRGRGDDPEQFESGKVHNLPVNPDDPTGDLYDSIAAVIDQHPEVADLLAKRTSLD
jgi:hypothetical protein